MKRIIMFFIFLSSINFYSQNYKGYYITNEKDTVNCAFEIPVILFDSEKFDPQTVRNKVKIITKNGEKIKFKPNQISLFYIEGTKNGNYTFVSISNKDYFFHEIIKGRLTYLKVYFNNAGGALGSLAAVRYYILKNGTLTELNPLNLRKGLFKQMEDYPELSQKWIDSDKYYKLDQFEEVVKLYNEHFQEEQKI